MLLLTTVAGPYDHVDDPENPGVFSERYETTDYVYRLETKLVTVNGPNALAYTGGYQGAPSPPAGFAYPLPVPVDQYPVPADPAAPGYAAGHQGQQATVYHDGQGGVRVDYDAGCDLRATVTATAPTVAGGAGTLTLTLTGSAALAQAFYAATPVGLALTGSLPQNAPLPLTAVLSGPPGAYLFTVRDARGCEVSIPASIPAFVPAAVRGCTDPYAVNFDPAANTSGGPTACTYAVRWRSAWQPVEVYVAALPAQKEAFVAAELRVGFRPGHPLQGARPLGPPLPVRASVGPDGYAVFRLGPYLRPQLGAPDGRGGYRLDLNSPAAATADLYVGYELRRAVAAPAAAGTVGELLEHGYAVNAAVPDEGLANLPGLRILSPFVGLPQWPGFVYRVPFLQEVSAGQYGQILDTLANGLIGPVLPCPAYPLPVAWLAPGGGYGYWVFQGRAPAGDDVAAGNLYEEATTGERRYSERGQARRTVQQASSGVFRGLGLLEGLRTLAASPQVWYQPGGAGTPWVPVLLESGAFPAGRAGVARQEVRLSFTHSAPEFAQGQ